MVSSNDTGDAGRVEVRVGSAPSDVPFSDSPIDDITAGCGGNCWCLTHEPEAASPGYDIDEVTVID